MLKPSCLLRLVLTGFVLSLPAATVLAQTFTGTGSLAVSATVYENEDVNNGGNYADVCVGNLQTGFMTRRGFFRFDLPDIPAGATVTRVTLGMQQDRVRDMGSGPKSARVALRRVSGSWDEGNGGFNNGACGGGTSSTGITWATQPGSVVAESGAVSLGTDESFNFSFDSNAGAAGLVSDVQAWVDGTPNNGWVISVDAESDADNARLLEIGTLEVGWTESEASGFSINPGLNDAWFNPATAGQGFFFTVFPESNLLFLSWFTFDTERPAGSTPAVLGEAGHRWLTALGPIEGDSATLDVTLSRGGVFDAPLPMVANEAYGTITVEFADCDNALLSYNFPGPVLSGSVPVERVVKDNVSFCEMLAEETGTQ